MCALLPPKPVPKGLFTAGLARLAYEKHVLVGWCTGSCRRWPPTGSGGPGHLCGALKQVAPLIAPWAEAIAATDAAGHVHADETSWQVFEDIEDKDGHRWWLWVFITSETTVFVMDTSRSAGVAAGELGIDREQTALEACLLLVTPRISTRPTSRWPASTAFDRSGAGPSAVFPGGPGPRTPRRSATGATRGPSGSLLYRAHHALAAATPGTDAHADAAGRWQRAFTISTRTASCRPATPGKA